MTYEELKLAEILAKNHALVKKKLDVAIEALNTIAACYPDNSYPQEAVKKIEEMK